MVLSLATLGAVNINEPIQFKSVRILGDYEFTSSDLTTVIVEIENLSVLEARHTGARQTTEEVSEANAVVITDILAIIEDVKIGHQYDYVFAGFEVEIPQNQIKTLATIPGVKAIYPNIEYQASQIEELSWELISPNMMNSAPHIQSQEAWNAGFTGKGITVAVIDTGVDYTHPDLAHAFGEYLGWDFVDNDADPQETNTGAMDRRTNHGTHVAGTIAANGQIKGVAPEATLLAYRVLGPGGSGTTANVIAGINRAVQDGADIMNLSLGADVNDPDYATSLALDRAMADGVVAVTSNGNSGPDNWTVGSPGTSREAISVGATQLPYNVYNSIVKTGEIEYSSAEVMGFPSDSAILELDGKELEYVYVGLGRPQDFVGKDVEGKVALIIRGEIPFVEKSDNAKANGAVATVIYNNNLGQIEAGISLPTIKLSNADGVKMLAELNAGNNTVAFGIGISHAVGETMADFSSRGPVMETWMIKPDVSAPGVGIVSTIPTHNPTNPHGYAAFQGTSMAAPHVAGAAALILEAHPDWGVDFVKAALMNTAVNLYDANGKLYPHNSQGAGSIRVMDAINTELLVTPGSYSFGVFENTEEKEVRRQGFTIHNLSDKRVRYSIEFTGNEGIKVKTSNNLQVQSGQTQELNFGVQVDHRLSEGYYEGTFLLSDGKNTIKVPTILFVGEPDYPKPLLTGAYFGSNGDGTWTVGAQIPQGADLIEYDMVRLLGNIPISLIGTFGSFENVPAPTHIFQWNGRLLNGNNVANGRYAMFIYVEKNGQSEYIGWIIEKR